MKITLSIDNLLRDTFLTVIQLRNGAAAEQGEALYQLCQGQVEEVRRQLLSAEYSDESIDHITYAQCALLDETVMGRSFVQDIPDNGHQIWLAKPLQAHFFNNLQAGEHLYVRIRTVLNQPAPDEAVLTCFHRILVLGFQGRYRNQQQGPRDQLIAILESKVPALETIPASVLMSPDADRCYGFFGRRSLWYWGGISLLAVAGLWWGLNHYLHMLLADLLPGPR
ncbi:type VI secretion system protein TssL, short form [Sodalis sp. dw_96]|uniref:type VI secretion system protein TssL, short form n=1 Tax=Sodalis sp. dw_96 TaxID=2719794 RepID=UPI001BD1DB93|nr:type VI secretion system protein TssL, short form [Sodalis sp. dw_96]